MLHLTILVPDGQNNLSSIIGSYKVFMGAESYWKSLGKRPVFQVQLAGLSEKVELYDGLFSIKPHTHVFNIVKTDLVIIPALSLDLEKSLKLNREMIGWLSKQRALGAEIASICTGAFLLASTGLLEGKNCSTHWMAATFFKGMFPGVNLLTDQLITDEQGIYTNGGAFSFLNLLLYLVEKYYDRQTAIYCSKVFQVDIERNSQSRFTMFTGQKDHQDEMILQAQAMIEEQIKESLSVENLADHFAISRRNFDRRFIKATGNTPAEYLQRVKMEAAKKELETGDRQISEVMYSVGYADQKAFRNTFKRITGLSPLEYRTRYHKSATSI
jgi:transcriptional regulator GlxA family with amidase domain